MGNCCKNNEEEIKEKNRIFQLNVPEQDYGSNRIKSTNSTIITFIPLNLFHQFKNLPNIYFLLICFLQVIPEISVTNGQPTTLVPLSFVILAVMVKDAYQQFCRFRKDREQNNKKVEILGHRGFEQGQWDEILTGHIFKIKKDQLIPCDAIIIKTSEIQNKCFIQTKSLDGQTNLKARRAPLSKFSLDPLSNQQLWQKRYPVQAEMPNQFLHIVTAKINIEKEQLPISIQNVVLRGCSLKNCAEAICVALYVGSSTKVIINSSKFSAKKSKMMIEIDKMVISIFIWQLMIALIASLFNTLFQTSYNGVMNYLEKTHFWVLTPSWWLMMTYFVPISLVVTMELIKLFQGGVASRDPMGYSKQSNCYLSVNNTSINENLGQIRYVFTDKTGTLTKNQMSFKKIIVGGKKYGERFDIPENKLKKDRPQVQFVSFGDSQFLNNLNSPKIQEMLRVIYLCHDVSVEKKASGKLQYSSGSPDEIALVNFAKFCGKELYGESQGYIKIYDHSTKTTVKFQKLALLEYSSQRKKMSVIVRTPANEVLMVTKGADSAVEKMLKPGQEEFRLTNKYLDEFGIQGLRTMLFGYRIIPENEWKNWNKIFKNAQTTINNRERAIDDAYNLIEKQLVLAGGTAVEDKLQDEVQETIINMKKAGMKFFILTGDKKQTAVNIGRSSGLVDSQARVISYPQQFNEEVKYYKGEKIYLIDASGPLPQLPPDLFHHQTICYRCTPAQKAEVVRIVKSKTSDLTLAIGDGANDVEMIIEADVGIGVKGKEGAEATRVADVLVGEFKFLEYITLYYGREWYRKNARLACFNFFKNWYHVSAVITYGAYSYFSAVQIFDIYAYELFNAFFAAFPIMVYAVFDEEYTYEQSKKYTEMYQRGLMNLQFNQIIYYKNITQGLAYGFISIVVVFMSLQEDILSVDGRTGYFEQSGAVLFFSIVMVVNFKILVMSNGVSVGLLLSVLFGIASYWMVYYVEVVYLDIQLKYSILQQWMTPKIIFIHILLIFLLIFVQFGIKIYSERHQKGLRRIAQNSRNLLVDELIGTWKPK